MTTSQPIPKEHIRKIATWLKDYDEKYYLIFLIGISTGLRISDILNLKVNDINNYKKVDIVEKKTSKRKTFVIKEEIASLLKDYSKRNNDVFETGFLFVGKKGSKLDRSSVFRTLQKCIDTLGLDIQISCHSLRKYFGKNLYEQTKDIGLLMEIFNHSSSKITLRYIGLTQERINEAYNNLDLGIAI